MRRALATLAAAGVLVLAACSGDGPAPTAPDYHRQQNQQQSTCSPDQTERLIIELFPKGGDSRTSALSRFKQVVRSAASGNVQGARHHAIRLVDFALERYYAGQLIGGTSTATANKLAEMLTGVLCLAGMPPFDPALLGLDAAAVVVEPNSPQTTIVTGTGFAGAQVEPGTVNEPTLFTIRRLPNSPGPLLTQLDQYPLFYEFHANGITFNVPVLVSTCVPDDANPPDINRLRLAHNVAPFTMGSIEILEPVAGASIVDCTTAGLAAAQRRGLDQLAHQGFQLLKNTLEKTLLPQPLYAARRFFGGAGLSGSVRTFSPFGGVDPVATMTPNDAFVREPPFGGFVFFVPGVTMTTPTGRAMEGLPITWTVTAGGGTVGNPLILTDANGFASAGSWQAGFVNPQALVAQAVVPAGVTVVNSPFTFTAVAHP